MNGYIYLVGKNCKNCKMYKKEYDICTQTDLYVIGVFACEKFERANKGKDDTPKNNTTKTYIRRLKHYTL